MRKTTLMLLTVFFVFTGNNYSVAAPNDKLLHPTSCGDIIRVANDDYHNGSNRGIYTADIKRLCSDSEIKDYNSTHPGANLPLPSEITVRNSGKGKHHEEEEEEWCTDSHGHEVDCDEEDEEDD